jgi:hypothetical protein
MRGFESALLYPLMFLWRLDGGVVVSPLLMYDIIKAVDGADVMRALF